MVINRWVLTLNIVIDNILFCGNLSGFDNNGRKQFLSSSWTVISACGIRGGSEKALSAGFGKSKDG